MEKREGSAFCDFPSKKIVSQYRNLRRETLLCLRKFPVSERFVDKRGGLHDFLSFFFLRVPKLFIRETLLLQKTPDLENFDAYEGDITLFCRKYNSLVQKTFEGETFRNIEKLCMGKFHATEVEEYHISPSKFLHLTAMKLFVGNPSFIQKNCLWSNFIPRWGRGITFSV